MNAYQLSHLSSPDSEIRLKAFQFGWYEIVSGREGYNLVKDMAGISPELFGLSLPQVLDVCGEAEAAVAADVLLRMSADEMLHDTFITKDGDELFKLAVKLASGSKSENTNSKWCRVLEEFHSHEYHKITALTLYVGKKEWMFPLLEELFSALESTKASLLLEGLCKSECNDGCLRLLQKSFPLLPSGQISVLLQLVRKNAQNHQEYCRLLVETLMKHKVKMTWLKYFFKDLTDVLECEAFDRGWRYDQTLKLLESSVLNESQFRELTAKLPAVLCRAAPQEQAGMWKKLEQVLKKLLKTKSDCWADLILLADECARAFAHSDKPAFLWLEKHCPLYDVKTIAVINFEVWLINQLKIHIAYGAHNFGSVVMKALVFLITVKAGKRIASQREDILSRFENWEVKLEFSQLEDVLNLLAKNIAGNEIYIAKLLNKAAEDDDLLNDREFGDDYVFELWSFIEEHRLEVPAFRRKYLPYLKTAEHDAKHREEILKSLEWQ